MPSIRIGFASDFTLKNQLVGVGTTTAAYKLNVSETIKGDFEVSGVTTFTSYSGFIPQKQNVSTASTIGFNTTGIGTVGITSFISVNETETGFISLTGEFNTLSEDLIIDDGKILDVSTIRNIGVTTIGTQNVYVPTSTTVSLGTLESLNIASHFSVPNGGINSRQQHPTEGMVRFNDDLNTLEFYNGVEWRQFTVDGSSGRGVFGGGYGPSFSGSQTSIIDFITISSIGNATNFGNLTAARQGMKEGASDGKRGLFCGGSPVTNIIEYVTIASEGNSIDFGDLLSASGRDFPTACASSTRGLIGGGRTTPSTVNIIEYVQISTLGNALDFGDLTQKRFILGGCASSTRGIFGGGNVDPSPLVTVIDFVTISSTGNAVNFGNLTKERTPGSCSNSTRGIFVGGYFVTPSSAISNAIDYITIASQGNSIIFGDLTQSRNGVMSASTSTRAIFAGGNTPSVVNTIDYITIASTGNAQDFGDLTAARRNGGSFSDSHGGLGGF